MAGVSRPAKTFTPKQGQYLAFINAYTRLHRQSPAETDMQEYFRVSPPSVHQMVLTLERGGFILRRRNPDNRRQLLISLTPEAHALLDRFDGPVAGLEARMIQGFDDAERDRFRDYLNRARSSLEGR